MRFKVTRLPLVLGIAGILAAGAAQAEPSALVEDITSDRDDVQLMDYLEPGQTIKLAADETIVIGYLTTCVQETITGGTVTIGQDESTVAGGKKESAWVDCDGGPVVAQVGAEQEAGAAGTRNTTIKTDIKSERMLFGVSPIIKLSSPVSEIEVTRLDTSEVIHRISANGLIVDLAEAKIALTPGGIYQAKAGDRQTVFTISRLSDEQNASRLARLLPL
ncbi:hypothetical protein [Hwanghaeella sp.]|uniref:hypothetical protein n=1 Tax=Hwanghaeella sp. TaxID=2605943 RepID=UPI003CCBFF82